MMCPVHSEEREKQTNEGQLGMKEWCLKAVSLCRIGDMAA